jgi:hypothetical protein
MNAMVTPASRLILSLLLGCLAAGCARSGTSETPDGSSADGSFNGPPDSGAPDSGALDSGTIEPPDSGAGDSGNPCQGDFRLFDGYCSGPCELEVLCQCADGTKQGAVCPENIAIACEVLCSDHGGSCDPSMPGGPCADAGG